MALSLIVGPANAGKVALLLDRYLDVIEREPILIVPNRSDVDRVERDLLGRTGALLGGTIGTFDDVFRQIARGNGAPRPLATEAQRLLVVRRAVDAAELNGLSASARFGGFGDALATTVAELESSLLDPGQLQGDLGELYRLYRAELEDLGIWDRELERRQAVERLGHDLSAWGGQPVFAYGFEDLTGAEWSLLETLAGRCDVTVSLPYEPARTAFSSLARTASDLATLASGRIEELPANPTFAPPPLRHLERALFTEDPPPAPPLDGSLRFLEAAGTRATLELVAEEALGLLRAGTAAEQIAVIHPSAERLRGALETAFGGLDVPLAVEAPVRLGQTPLGRALLGLLRFAWLGGGRRDLFAFLRSPYSGLSRSSVDFLEGRLRGRAIEAPAVVEEEAERLRGAPLPVLGAARTANDPLAAVDELLRSMLRAAYGLERPPAGDAGRADLRAYEAARRVLDELRGWRDLGGSLGREEVAAALDRTPVSPVPAAEEGRVAALDLLRARTRRFEVVFLVGLEEGSLPRRGIGSPFLDDDLRRELDERGGARLQRPDQVSRDRYLFYTACTRASRRLYLVREAATDDGSSLEPSPFWTEARALFPADELERWTQRRRLSALTWPLESAPTDRERLRALAALTTTEPDAAESLARANGWERRLRRARTALARPTRLRHQLVREQLASRVTFNVTELERFADCSSAWFVERLLDPRTIDAEVDPKLRGSVAHAALYKFFSGLPRELGIERVEPERVEDAVRFMRRCLERAIDGVRMEMTEMQRRELEQGLARDLEQFVRAESESTLGLVPRRFEVLFGSDRSAPELQRGLELGDGAVLSGKIDRIDVDPFSARGIVQDYKAGKSAHSAAEIEKELRLQIPLYMLVLRDLVGVEPLGGLYRPLAGGRKARGLLRSDEGLDGFAKNDYRDEEQFWLQLEGARETARGLAQRIRAGDVRHDPRGDECPSWCDLWPICRVRRA